MVTQSVGPEQLSATWEVAAPEEDRHHRDDMTDQGDTVTPTVRPAADQVREHRRRQCVLAGLELAWRAQRLFLQWRNSPPDACRGRCGALDTQARQAWSQRESCPCREAPNG
jgi:hypothetical protein